MLLYYSMEARTYGWYMLFATLSFWAYTENQWVWWTIATILGFYTHSYFLIIPFAQIIHSIWTHKIHWKPYVVAGLCIAPWSLRLITQVSKLQQSWYFPVNLNLVGSVLGNLFVGYEGTPWYIWNFTKVLSLMILFLVFCAAIEKDKKNSMDI